MFCTNCGQQLNGNEQVCPNCNTPVTPNAQQPYGAQPQYPPQQPYGTQPPYQPPYQLPYGAPQVSQEPAPFGLRVICFLFMIVGIILYFVKKDEKPVYAKQCLKASLIGVGVSVGLYIIFIILMVVFGMALY